MQLLHPDNENIPLAHEEQLRRPSNENRPAEQGGQVLVPSYSAKCPLAQSSQEPAPTGDVNLPTGQGVHLDDPSGLYVPALQGLHMPAALFELVPAAQGVQDVLPDTANDPAEHIEHFTVPSSAAK